MFNPYNNLFGNFITRKFSDIFPDVDTFVNDWKDSGLYSSEAFKSMGPTATKSLYYLLYARYGNSNIASYDENQFKYKVFSIMYMYGPTWEKRLDIQYKLRALKEEELFKGSKRINNVSLHPSTKPTTDTLEELTTINQQVVDGWKKSKVEGYASLMAILDTDVTEEFISKFKKLFITVVEPNLPLWYITQNTEGAQTDEL